MFVSNKILVIKTTCIMRKLSCVLVCSFLFLLSQKLSAQTTPPVDSVYQDWTGLIETQTECEIYYSLVQCGDERKVLLKFMNEVPFNQNIKIKVTVKYIGYTIKEEKTKTVAPNLTIIADCSSTDANLFIKLLPRWDLTKTTVTAELIQATTN
jgi:hypothetical protein